MHLLVIILAVALAIALALLVWNLNRRKPEPPSVPRQDSVLGPVRAGSAAAELPAERPDGPARARPPLLPPTLLEEPQDRLVLANEVAILKVQAQGERVSYQWRRNGEEIPGAVEPFLLVSDLDIDGGRFAVRVSNEAGAVHSREAAIRVQATSLVAGDPDYPSIQISRWSDHHQLGPEVRLNEQLKVLLGNLLEKAPGLAMATKIAAGPSLYVMRLSSDMVQALSSGSGTAQLMLEKGSEAIRGNIVRGSRIIGQASFLDVSKQLQVTGVALAVWQLMAIITAQKFLADINRRLGGIEHALQDLKDWVEEEAFSTLTSNHRYLCQVASALGTQSLNLQESTTFLNQIEHIDRECAKLQGLFRQRSLAALEDFRTQDVQGSGLKDNTQELQKHGLQYLRMHFGHLNALRVRCAAAQVRLALPATPELVGARLAEIRTILAESQTMLRIFSEISQDQLRRLKGRFSKDKTDEAQRELVVQALDPALANLRNTSAEIASGLGELDSAAADILDRYHHGLGLAVELGPSGEVLRVSQVAR